VARKVVWTESAWRDLEQAADYIARDSPHYAAAFVLEVNSASATLAHLPHRARKVPELNDPSIRELLVGSYRLIFLVSGESVYILGLIHQARDFRRVGDLDSEE